jgi:hypothetical protein
MSFWQGIQPETEKNCPAGHTAAAERLQESGSRHATCWVQLVVHRVECCCVKQSHDAAAAAAAAAAAVRKPGQLLRWVMHMEPQSAAHCDAAQATNNWL